MSNSPFVLVIGILWILLIAYVIWSFVDLVVDIIARILSEREYEEEFEDIYILISEAEFNAIRSGDKKNMFITDDVYTPQLGNTIRFQIWEHSITLIASVTGVQTAPGGYLVTFSHS